MAYDKLVDSAQLDSDLGDIADAIRAKSGGSSQLAFPAGFVSEIGSISGGGGSFEGLQLVSTDATTGKPTRLKWNGTSVPPYGAQYCYYGLGNSSPCVCDCTEIEEVGAYGFASAGMELINTESITHVNTYGLSIRIAKVSNDLTGKTLNLANYTGYGIGNSTSVNSVMRANEPNNFYGTILCPKIEYIPQYFLYGVKVDMVVQLGSIGYPVKASGDRPFGGSMTGTNTVTIYTTGTLLDTIKTPIQNQAGSSTTFIYKASEATTYGGNSYAAGDTMLTA